MRTPGLPLRFPSLPLPEQLPYNSNINGSLYSEGIFVDLGFWLAVFVHNLRTKTDYMINQVKPVSLQSAKHSKNSSMRFNATIIKPNTPPVSFEYFSSPIFCKFTILSER